MFLTGSYILHVVSKGLIGLIQTMCRYFAQLHHVHAGVCCTHPSIRYVPFRRRQIGQCMTNAILRSVTQILKVLTDMSQD